MAHNTEVYTVVTYTTESITPVCNILEYIILRTTPVCPKIICTMATNTLVYNAELHLAL